MATAKFETHIPSYLKHIYENKFKYKMTIQQVY